MSDSQRHNRKSLRELMRSRRRNLSPYTQKVASRNLLKNFHKSGLHYRVQHVALYLANDGEIDPKPLLDELLRLGKKCYLPILNPFSKNHLLFCRYSKSTRLRKNRYGILEPELRTADIILAKYLDLVLVPLVSFDEQGNRMGMGGGYYDRTFAFKSKATSKLPKLIGLAHECQKIDRLPVESWDIPLHGIVTDQQFYLAK